MISLTENPHKLKKLYSHSDVLNLVVFDDGSNKISPEINSSEYESRVNVVSVNTDHNEFLDEQNEMPDDWINYNFDQKRSCILSNIYSTCVTKAINHLESLQLSIDKYLEIIECDGGSVSTSPRSSESSKIFANFVKRKSMIKNKHIQNANQHQKLRFQDENSQSKQLSIQGYGFDLEIDKSQIVVVENEPPVEDLRANSVLEEILVLIARLEIDRKRTEKLLKRERENLNTLKSCIENMALKRAIEIPMRVQHEHDACITDITELNWHISFNTKAERKLTRKVEIEERLHQHLIEQITDIKKNTPLIEQKINSEKSVIDKIEAAQADVDEFVNKSKVKLQQTQEKSEASYNKAAKEREAIQADLASCKRDLNKAKKRLQDALDSLDEYSRTIIECAKKVEENIAQEKIETSKRIELKSKHETLNDENKAINVDIFHVEKNIEKVTKQNEEKNKTIDDMNKRFNEELAKLTDVLNKKLDKLDKILKKKQEKEVDLEEMARDRYNMENKIAKEERNRERLLEDRQRSEEELRTCTVDLGTALKLNATTVADYEKEMRRLENKEENLKKQIAELRKQIGEERNQLSNLINRLNTETDDYLRAQIQNEQKRTHFERKKIEMDGRMTNMELRVEEIEAKKDTIVEEVRILNEKLNSTLTNHRDLESKLTKRIEQLEPLHAKASSEYYSNKANLDYMKSHSIEMNTKMEEMAESRKLLVKSIEKTSQESDILENELGEFTIQYESSKRLDDENKTEMDEIQKRIQNYKTNNLKNKQERSDYLKKLQEQLDSYLELNKELAARYRYIKYASYNRRLDLMKQIEIKLNSYVGIKDKRQVISLQERMHNALNDFFKFRVQNGEKNYYDLKEERENIGDEINSLENLLNQSVIHMARFLENQTDFDKVRQKAIQKVLKQELIDKQNEEQLERRKNKMKEIEEDKQEEEDLTGMFNLPTEGITLRSRNRNVKMVAFDLVSPV